MSQFDNQTHLNLQNPFPGLSSYGEIDRKFFYGRKTEMDELFRRVQRDPLTVLFGKSGLGKTSLIQAGLFPLLRESQYLPIPIRLSFGPKSPEFEQQISLAVAKALEQAKAEGETLRVGETVWEFFHRVHMWSGRNRLMVPVLVLDQFEEIFTLGQNDPRTTLWLQSLGDLIENRIPRSVRLRIEASGETPDYAYDRLEVRVLLALREDFLPDLEDLKPLIPSLAINRMRLTPFDGLCALEAVQRPVPELMDEAVAEEIVRFVAGAEQGEQCAQPLDRLQVEPSLLNLICHQLNQRRLDEGAFAVTSALLRGSKDQLLEDFYANCLSGLPQSLTVFVEEQLITPSGFRRAETLDNALTIPGVDHVALQTLIDRRLLRREERFNIPHLELIHDVLTQTVQESRDRHRAEAERQARRQREVERAKLRWTRCRAFMGAASVILLLMGIAFYIYGWKSPYRTYSRAFTKRWGITYPVGSFPSSSVAHRAWTYRFTYKGRFGELQKVEVVDANHQLVDIYIGTYLTDPNETSNQLEQASRFEFVYDHKGRVIAEIARNRFEWMVWGFFYVFPRNPDEEELSAKGMFVGPAGNLGPRGRSRAEVIEFRYDRQGYEIEHRYTNLKGQPAPGPDDAYGRKMEYDEKGRLKKLTSLNEEGEAINGAAGNAGMEIDYDAVGNMIRVRAFDAKGEPTLLKSGYHEWRAKYDDWGREIERSFFNLRNELAADTDQTGAHSIKWKFDDRGNMKSVKLYDISGLPIEAGWQIFDFLAHEQSVKFNEQNRPETVTYFDGMGNALMGPDGWHGFRMEYDEHGFISAISLFDEKYTPVKDIPTGIHRKELVNNAFGQLIEERFFDLDRKPIVTLDGGYHLRKIEYDNSGNPISQTYFGVNGQAVLNRTEGAHRVVQQFDRFSNPTLKLYLDEADRPINNKEGFHRVASTYNKYGDQLETRWYDKEARPCKGPDEVECISYDYDDRGLQYNKVYYDAEGHPALNKGGIHKIHYEYNDKRQQTQYQVFALKAELAEDLEGNHLVLHEFDQRGRETKVKKIRADGSPNWDRELGIATRKQLWDKENRWIEQAYFDEKDALVIGPDGFARGARNFESDGSSTDTNMGIDDKPMFNPLAGWAIRKIDAQGNTTSYHGPDGALINGPEGYAEMCRNLSDDEAVLSEAFYGLDGTPVFGPLGYHRADLTASGKRYFDAQGDEIPSFGPDAFVSLIYIAEIPTIDQTAAVKQPAAKVGLQAGDILWRYGDWSFPEALHTELVKGTSPDAIFEEIAQGFIGALKRLSEQTVSMNVIRNGIAMKITVPPLLNKRLGVHLKVRAISVGTFESWKTIAVEKE